ncbi:hypothetical protein [Streptomyces sp. McG3]|uniref:hypothetical protein n=1 Tax=Streptomyces sp. McG3 TaxID=2725483 RepID=UPI001BED2FF7|nr:hypothetical protein [Streptomyces sp. McG3]
MRKPCRVLVLTPHAELVRAVADTGLEPWALRRAGPDAGPGGRGGVPPERTLVHPDPVRALRELAADDRSGFDFVLSGEDAEPALLDVLRHLAPPPARTGTWPPTATELRRLLGEDTRPRPGAADGTPVPMCRVDTVSVGGMHLLLDVAWPASAAPVGETLWADVREKVRGALDLIGQESGGMRTSVALTAAGPRPVEMARTPFLVASLGPGTRR